RHPTAAALFAVCGLGVVALLAGFAWHNARLGRERDRAEANFAATLRAADVLVTELAEGVRPIAGTQSPRVAAILRRAEQVYDDRGQRGDSTAVRAGKARLRVAFADIDLELGDVDSARAAADEARTLYEGLLAGSPGDPAYRAGLARALELHGRALAMRGRL